MSNKVIKNLEKVLANYHHLYLKTQNYHWNVEGPNFKSLHKLFEEQYDDLAEAIDTIAESIRSLGDKTIGSWKEYQPLIILEDGDKNKSATEMIKDLIIDQDKIQKLLQKTSNIARENNDDVIEDLMTERLAVHRKNRWILDSNIK